MKSVIIKSAAPLLLLACAIIAPAQPVVTTDAQLPVVIETDTDLSIRPVSAPLPTGATKVEIVEAKETKHDQAITKVWIGSMAGVVGASGMDAASSWGKTEGNAFLRSANGTFGAKGLMIKGGLAGATLVPEVLMRNHKQMRKTFAIANMVQTTIFSGIALHNLSIPVAAVR